MCAPGQAFDEDSCECFCDTDASSCEAGERFNAMSCACVPDEGCPPGSPTAADCGYAEFDEDACDCLCVDNDARRAACESDGVSMWLSAPLCLCQEEGGIIPPPPATGCKGIEARCGCPYLKEWNDGECVQVRWIENEDGRCDA